MPNNKKNGKSTNSSSKSSGVKISLCMMVKDEERLLPRCLDSVKDVADEIILVDTGSKDRTVAIAESYGAHVYHHPWENDFSKHRNQSISYATGDWILIMDADEELEAKTRPVIKSLVKSSPTGVISFNVRSYLEDGAYYSEGSSPRLFKNGLGIHYNGRIHNQIVFREAITPSSVVLWHYGYDLGAEKKKAKMERSLTLLRQQVGERPDDVATRHHLAMTLMAGGEWEGAQREAMKVVQISKDRGLRSPQLAWTYFVAANSLLQMGDYQDAEIIGQEGVRLFDWSIDLHHCLTQLYFAKKDIEKTLTHGATFLDLCEKLTTDISAFPIFQFETVHRDWVIYRAMGYANIYLGQQEQGIALLEKAAEKVSKHERLHLIEEIGLNLLKIGQRAKAIGLLAMLPLGHPSVFKGARALARAYEDAGQKREAADTYQKLEDVLPEDPEIPFRRGLLLLDINEYARAAKAFETVAGRAPNYADAIVNWGLALEKLGFFEQAEEKYRHAFHVGAEVPKASLNLGLLLFRQSRYQEALPLLQQCFVNYPTDIPIALALSKASLEVGNVEGMIGPCEHLLRALEIPAERTLQSVADLADLYLMIADGLLAKGQVAAFEMAADIGLGLGPGTVAIIADLTSSSLDKGNYGLAVRLLQSGLLLSPGDERLASLIQSARHTG